MPALRWAPCSRYCILRQVVLSIRPEGQTSGELLVPFVTAIVPTVSVADGLIEIDPPEGLLDPDFGDSRNEE